MPTESDQAEPRRRPEDLLERVENFDSFLEFVQALAEDFEDEYEHEKVEPTPYLGLVQGKNGWYDYTIHDFLYAAISCADGHRSDITAEPLSWRMLAQFLYCGKIYE